jgi:hypothetical protein
MHLGSYARHRDLRLRRVHPPIEASAATAEQPALGNLTFFGHTEELSGRRLSLRGRRHREPRLAWFTAVTWPPIFTRHPQRR